METGENFICGKNTKFDKTVIVGHNAIIGSNVILGKNVIVGDNCIIKDDCIVGEKTKIEHFVLLKKGTVIGENCYIDSYVKSSGQNKIGNNVTLRFNSTIAREVTIEDDVFISPNVMTIYSDHKGVKQGGTLIKKGSHIGTNVVINQAVIIGENVSVGAMSFVKDNCESNSIYIGIPAKLKRLKH